MKLAIIGGSLFKQINGLSDVIEERIKTPFGEPSAEFTMGKIHDMDLVYLNRHGVSHQLEPHQINYRANMFALKLLEVTHIIGIAAVGGITEKMAPLKCVVPDQLIDYTYGRMQTFSDGFKDEVMHIDFSYPYAEVMRDRLIEAAATCGITCEANATYGVTQGPRLETIAEIKRLKQDGCDIVGMTGMPEAALARELEMDYVNLSLVVNWAAGAETVSSENAQQKHEVISMDEIKTRIVEGNQIVEKLINATISTMSNY